MRRISLFRAVQVEVIAGAHNINVIEGTQQSRIAGAHDGHIVVHENWDPAAVAYDIALLKISDPFELSAVVAIIRLPSLSDSRTWSGYKGKTSGWGRQHDGPAISDKLNYVETDILTNMECNNNWSGSVSVYQLCCSGADGKSPCSGDSGSPVAVRDESDGQVTQVGIVSYGILPSCTVGYPHVYSRTSSFLRWIRDNSDYIPRP